MKSLSPIFNLFRLAYYRWALAEIHPLHPDVPAIVCRINQLERHEPRMFWRLLQAGPLPLRETYRLHGEEDDHPPISIAEALAIFALTPFAAVAILGLVAAAVWMLA